jgi:hypothetical protein
MAYPMMRLKIKKSNSIKYTLKILLFIFNYFELNFIRVSIISYDWWNNNPLSYNIMEMKYFKSYILFYYSAIYL